MNDIASSAVAAGPARRDHAEACLRRLYQLPLTDLGSTGNAALDGIFSPTYDPELVSQYVQSQFTDGMEWYVERYQNLPYWKCLISLALERVNRPPRTGEVATILDLGSGAGNTILPLLELFPSSVVIASDLSVPMLAGLRKQLLARDLRQQCAMLQLNAEDLDFPPQCFDLVVGGAILHHLFRPERVIEGCARILKPGGCAIFFEPFESGNAILTMAYREILQRNQSLIDETRSAASDSAPDNAPPLPVATAAFLQEFSHQHEIRKGRCKDDEVFQRLDDKWLFTQRFFQEQSASAGFQQCIIDPLHPSPQPFIDQTRSYMVTVVGKPEDAMPPWAWAILQRYETMFSADLKSEMFTEGRVIFRKAP